MDTGTQQTEAPRVRMANPTAPGRLCVYVKMTHYTPGEPWTTNSR